MKRALLCLIAVSVLVLPWPSAAEPAAVPAVSTAELVQLLAAPSADNSPQPAEEPFLAAGWSCPFYTIQCTTNASCDAYCGAPGWGVCESFGSPVRKCCTCLG